MSGMRDRPSRRLYSLWAWRWTNCGAIAASSRRGGSAAVREVYRVDPGATAGA